MEWEKVMENDEWGWGSVRGIGDRGFVCSGAKYGGRNGEEGMDGDDGKAVEWLGDGGIWGRGGKGSKGKQLSGE